MLVAPKTIFADLSDLYYADAILLGLREQVATWLDDETLTREQATQMLNWLFAHARFQNVAPEQSIQKWISMVKALGIIPEGYTLTTTEKGILAVL